MYTMLIINLQKGGIPRNNARPIFLGNLNFKLEFRGSDCLSIGMDTGRKSEQNGL